MLLAPTAVLNILCAKCREARSTVILASQLSVRAWPGAKTKRTRTRLLRLFYSCLRLVRVRTGANGVNAHAHTLCAYSPGSFKGRICLFEGQVIGVHDLIMFEAAYHCTSTPSRVHERHLIKEVAVPREVLQPVQASIIPPERKREHRGMRARER